MLKVSVLFRTSSLSRTLDSNCDSMSLKLYRIVVEASRHFILSANAQVSCLLWRVTLSCQAADIPVYWLRPIECAPARQLPATRKTVAALAELNVGVATELPTQLKHPPKRSDPAQYPRINLLLVPNFVIQEGKSQHLPASYGHTPSGKQLSRSKVSGDWLSS